MVQGPLKFSVTSARDGELVIGVIREAAGLSQNQAKKLIRTGKVYLGSSPVLDWRQPVPEGALVSVDTDRKNPKRIPDLEPERILHADETVVVVDKPANIVSVPPTTTGEPTLLHKTEALLAGQGRTGSLLPLHRLDRETCGLMVFGLAGSQLEPLQRQFARHEVHRAYYAVVFGRPHDALLEGEIDVTRREFGGRKRRQFASTRVELLEARGQVALLICRPRTGRWHQLRIQLAGAGWPIVGERRHLPSGFEPPFRAPGLALQSHYLSFVHPVSAVPMTWKIDLEPTLARILSGADRQTVG